MHAPFRFDRRTDAFFTYRPDGSLKTITDNTGAVTTFTYASSPVAHAPKRIVGGDVFTYDANGNMTTGLNGKVRIYDGENRPLKVIAANGDVARYVYAADGTRLKRIVTANGVTTTSLYFGEVEIVNPGAGEEVRWYPHPNVKITRSGGAPIVTYLHRDQLDSVVLIASASGGEELERIYAPFGEDTEYGLPAGEDIRLRDQRFGKHTARSLARDFCQWIINLFGLAEGQDRCIFFHGVSLLVRFWQASTPATIRRLSKTAITQIHA